MRYYMPCLHNETWPARHKREKRQAYRLCWGMAAKAQMKYLSNSWQNKKQGIGWPCSLHNVIDHSHTLRSCRGCGWNTLCSHHQAPRKHCLHFPLTDCYFRSPTTNTHTRKHTHARTYSTPLTFYPLHTKVSAEPSDLQQCGNLN